MSEFEFVLVIDGPLDDDTVIDQLYERGCSDATFGSVDGVGLGEFAREAPSFADAVMSAIRDLRSVRGLQVMRVEPDDLVTLSEIAERLGRTRESVRLLVSGERGRGDFPPPISHLRARSRLWRWSDVAAWAGVVSEDERERATFVRVLNAALELRARHDLPRRQREFVDRLVAS